MDIFFFLKDYMNPVADEDCIKVYMEQIPRGQQKMASECSKNLREDGLLFTTTTTNKPHYERRGSPLKPSYC